MSRPAGARQTRRDDYVTPGAVAHAESIPWDVTCGVSLITWGADSVVPRPCPHTLMNKKCIGGVRHPGRQTCDWSVVRIYPRFRRLIGPL
eukprot:1175746-Prorocentrum_minimum.AAC.1